MKICKFTQQGVCMVCLSFGLQSVQRCGTIFNFFLYIWESNAHWIILNHFESILLFKKIILIYMYIYVGRKYVIYWPPPVPYILEENGWKNFFYYLMSYNYMLIMKDFFILKTKKFNNGFNSVWQCPVNNKYTCIEWSY